jgi:hypothetical protein
LNLSLATAQLSNLVLDHFFANAQADVAELWVEIE